MQLLSRASDDFPFFSRPSPPRTLAPSAVMGESPGMEQSVIAPFEFVSKATSVIRTASSRARRALVELKDEIVHDVVPDIMNDLSGGQLQAQSQAPGWVLPWAGKSEESRQREEMQRKIRQLAREPFRFLVPSLPPPKHQNPSGHASIERAAEGTLAEEFISEDLLADPNLKSLKDELVPGMLSDAEFWRRYLKAVREIEHEVVQKYSAYEKIQPDPGRVFCSDAPTSPESTTSSGFPWSSSGTADYVSPVRQLLLDDDKTEEPEASTIAQRSTSEQAAAAQGPLDLETSTCLRASSSYPEGVPMLASLSGAFGSVLMRHVSSIPPEETAEESGEAKDWPGISGSPFSWLQRTVSGASSTSGVPPDIFEGTSSNVSLSNCPPSPPEAVFPTDALRSTTDVQSFWHMIPADGLPSAGALHHLYTAYVSSAGYSSCRELAQVDASAMLNWPGIVESVVGARFRRSSGGQQAQGWSPSRWGPWASPPRGCEMQDILEEGCNGLLPESSHSALVDFLFRVDRQTYIAAGPGGKSASCFTRTLHGAPLGSFVAELAHVMTQMSSVQAMAQLWLEVVARLSWHFRAGQPIPGIPVESLEHPDLQLCELMQHLQLLNLCMDRRKHRRQRLADEAKRAQETGLSSIIVPAPGQALRKGVKEATSGMLLLGTGEPLCIPETQDVPLMTETSVREVEELIIRTGTMGAGCAQLFSDMQAFKAANPGCLLEDFVRWYSPPDWSPVPYAPSSMTSLKHGRVSVPDLSVNVVATSSESAPEDTELTQRSDSDAGRGEDKLVAEGLSGRGYLSIRMTFEGNQWQQLWEMAKPVPAIEQVPLFDVEEGGERSLKWLLDISPSDLLEQLFISLVGLGLSAAHALPESGREPLRTSLVECAQYCARVCSQGMGQRKQLVVCRVYEVLETARAATNYAPLFEELKLSCGDGQGEEGGVYALATATCHLNAAEIPEQLDANKVCSSAHSLAQETLLEQSALQVAAPSSDANAVTPCVSVPHEQMTAPSNATEGKVTSQAPLEEANQPGAEPASPDPLLEGCDLGRHQEEASMGSISASVDENCANTKPSEAAGALNQAATSLFKHIRAHSSSWSRLPGTYAAAAGKACQASPGAASAAGSQLVSMMPGSTPNPAVGAPEAKAYETFVALDETEDSGEEGTGARVDCQAGSAESEAKAEQSLSACESNLHGVGDQAAVTKPQAATLHHAAASFFHRVKSGPSWSRASVPWSVPQGLKGLSSLQRGKSGLKDIDSLCCPGSAGLEEMKRPVDEALTGATSPIACEEASSTVSEVSTPSCLVPGAQGISHSISDAALSRGHGPAALYETGQVLRCGITDVCSSGRDKVDGDWIIL